VQAGARERVLAAADRLLLGEWDVFGTTRTDMRSPDWFRDPVTGRRPDPARYAFRVEVRSEDRNGNIKQLWEVSRLQHLTVLAAAWYLSGDERYARMTAAQLRSWWRSNLFLSGIHWTSGIEAGLRLIAFAWIRRLLADWPDVSALFEHDPLAVAQIRWHCEYLAAFPSRGSSANNHVIAEAAGLLAGACAFGWYPRSQRWRRGAADLLERSFLANTFGSGAGRELASDYQGFIAELVMVAAVESAAAGHRLGPALWERLCRVTDCCAALLDCSLRPPRQGDSDDGRALLLEPPVSGARWTTLLRLGETFFGRQDWWPRVPEDAGSVLIGALAPAPPGHDIAGRPARRPHRFADAGITLLRTSGDEEPEIWCRCDGGPHGFGSIAAHAHADALSVEVRHGGVDVLADPGTYCYHGEPEFRSYFRSTIGHNTVELDGRDQSRSGGPFLWTRHARSRETEVTEDSWTAEHHGYEVLSPAAVHRRSVRLDRRARALQITDTVAGGDCALRLAFHLGPSVLADLDGAAVMLRWPEGSAALALPPELTWTAHSGQTGPVLGWYSPGLGRRTPATTLVGTGRCPLRGPLITRLEFISAGRPDLPARSSSIVHAEAQ
jgi:hypothetical protein